MENENILVSVVVVTFNAEATIIKALNSVYNQSYENIELIITDDSSKDRTCNLCREWIEEHSERFKDVALLESTKNTGVTLNINRGFRRCTGKWIKELAGDDLLSYNAIEMNVKYVIKNNIDTICCSKSASFIETEDGGIKFIGIKPDHYTEHVFKLNAKQQYKKMLYEYIVLIPTTAFFNREMLKKFDYFDESFSEIDDQPFFLRISVNGVKIHYNSELISYYHRTGINSISQSKDGMMNKEAFKVNGKLHRQDKRFILPNIPKYHIIFYYNFYLDLFRRHLIISVFGNRKNVFTISTNRILMFFQPYALKKKIYNSITGMKDKKKDQNLHL